MRLRWRLHLLAILSYTLLALVLTWPLLTHFLTQVPGNGADDPPLTWNLWWVARAVVQLQSNPFRSSPIFYPIGINLAFYTLTTLNGLLSVPLQAIFGLIPASNLLLLSSFVLSGYGAFLLATYVLHPQERRQTQGRIAPDQRVFPAAAFSAGLLYAFASNKLFYAALGQWNIASSQWIPFYILYLFKMGDSTHRLRYSLLAGLFLLFQAYAELTYASFLALFTVLWALWRMWAMRPPAMRGHIRRLALNLALVALVSAAGLTPVLANMLPDLRAEGDIFAEGGGFSDIFSADLAGFAVPTTLHPLLGTFAGRLQFPHDVGQHLYVGYSVLLLALVGIFYWRHRSRLKARGALSTELPPAQDVPSHLTHQTSFWCQSALVWWLLTLGPTLRINGHDSGIPLPFRLVGLLPFFSGNRYPSRYGVLLILSMAMLVALGVGALLDRSRHETTGLRRGGLRLAAPLVVLFMLFEHLSAPLPLSDMTIPKVYHETASLSGDWTLLDIPVAWRNGSRVTGTLDTIIMFEQYYQSAHQKQLLAGNTSRNPPLKFQYYSEAPVISTLVALETGHEVGPEVTERDRALAPEVLRFLSIQAIVVHMDQAGPLAVPYLETTMPVTRFHEDEDTIGYWVDLPPWPDQWIIQPGDELSRLSYAEGWSAPASGWIWSQRKEARLLVPMNGHSQVMTFRAYAHEAGQKLSIAVNGVTVETVLLDAAARDYQVQIPSALAKAGLNEVLLHFEQLFAIDQVPAAAQTIGQTGLESKPSLVVQSAGNEVGDFGLVFVDGSQVSPNQRGYNVVVLDPLTGSVDDARSFDTHLDPSASAALAAYLEQVPQGKLVAVAAADEASRLLGPEAVEALRGIGAAGDLRGKFRWGHAIIGMRGAPPGTALEAMDWMRTATLSMGFGATEPHLSAAFGSIAFTSAASP